MWQKCPKCRKKVHVFTKKVKLKKKAVWVDYCAECKTALSMEDFDDSKT